MGQHVYVNDILSSGEEEEHHWEVYGMGLPYTLENWPQYGDVWGRRTRRRVVLNSKHFQDRYLYLFDWLFRLLEEEKEEKEISKSRLGSKKFC